MDGTLALKKYGLMNSQPEVYDVYKLSNDGNNNIIIQKFRDEELVTTYTCHTGSYNVVNVDEKFTVTCTLDTPYFKVVLLEASTDAPAGTEYGWGYGETPSITEIVFKV